MTDKIIPFTMPKWGIEMEEGVIREWHAEEGDAVKEGDLFAVIETDKIANDVELEFSSTLRRRIGKEEEAYPVGALIAVFADKTVSDNEIDKFVAEFKAADAGFSHGVDSEEKTANAKAAPSEKPPSPAILEGVSISPKALELAKSVGVDLSSVSGSGRNGRISLQDVEQAAKNQGLVRDGGDDAPGYDVVKLTSMRRTIAKRLSEAARDVPQYYVRAKINVDPLIELRARKKEEGAAPSLNDYLIKACAIALMQVRDVNVQFAGDAIHRFHHADINVAVAVPGGLIAPVIRGADQKSVEEIAAAMRDLAERARDEKLEQHEYQPGSFSLSNLGMFGVSSFDAFINPPMGAILAVGAAARAPAESGGFESIMTATLTCDHRVIDGALAGEFLQALKKALAAPEAL